MKNNRISPVGLKGNQINERMKELMGVTTINENKSSSSIELTKMGPDGNAYAIVRENREWYIKKADKTTNLVAEDFKYIGGLQNKKKEAHSSYSSAVKKLNFKFKSLAEAHNFTGEINIFENDNLLSEAGFAGFAEMTGNGFSNEGNMEHNDPIFEVEDDEVEMTEAEEAIDEMLTTEVRGPWSKNKNLDDDIVNNHAEDEDEDEDETVKESRMSVKTAIEKIDEMIDFMTESVKKKV